MKKYIAIFIISLVPFFAGAQGENSVGETVFMVNYLPSLSLGETADFTSGFSPRGIDFEANKFITEDLSVGFNVSWNVFREKISGETFEYEDLTITGTQFRYVNTTPLDVNVKKYFVMEGAAPYVGVGLGTMYAKQTNEIGVFSLNEDKWLFHVAPEVGIIYDASRNNVLSFKVKYNYGPKAGDFPSVSYLSFGLGIGLK